MGEDVGPSFSVRLYWATWKAINLLPSFLANPIAKVLRIKIPTNPAALAACLLVRAGDTLKGLKKHAHVVPPSESSVLRAFGETLAAHYCLSVVVLGQDKYAGEHGPGSIWNLYTALTYKELRRLVQQVNSQILPDELMEEAEALYLMDKPTLDQLTQKLSKFCLKVELDKVKESHDWFPAFVLKAQTRIAESAGVHNRDPRFIPVVLWIEIHLSGSMDLFRWMRPSFRDYVR